MFRIYYRWYASEHLLYLGRICSQKCVLGWITGINVLLGIHFVDPTSTPCNPHVIQHWFALITSVENDFQRMLACFCSVLLHKTTFAEQSDTLLHLATVSCYALQVVASTIDYSWSIFQAIMKMLTKAVIWFVLIAAIFTVVSQVADCVSPAKQRDRAINVTRQWLLL